MLGLFNHSPGRFKRIGGILYEFDDVRGKWLSVSRVHFAFSTNGNNVGTAVLSYGGSMVPNVVPSNVGPRMMRAATIVGAASSAAAVVLDTYSFDISARDVDDDTTRDVLTAGLTLVVEAGPQSTRDVTLNLDLDENEMLGVNTVRGGGTATAQDPTVEIEVAWRLP